MFKFQLKLALLVLSLSFYGGCGDDDDPVIPPISGSQLIIGTVIHDDVSDSARLRLAAVKMAVDEINASKAFGAVTLKVQNISPSKGDAADPEKAKTNTRELHDTHKAIGVISIFSSLGKAISDVTQSAPYDKFVQCNASASNPDMNDSKALGDKTDTFYRTVVTDFFQGRLTVKVLEENQWKKIAIYHLEDPFGTGLTEVIENNLSAGYTVDIKKSHPIDFVKADETADMDDIINAGVDVVLLPTLKNQSPDIIAYLVDEGYKGAIILGDGAKTEDIFTIATGLKAWVAEPGNKLLGTEPDNYGGNNSKGFSDAFKLAVGEEVNSYSSTAYDCAFAIAFAAAYAGKEGATKDEDVWAGMQNFKEGVAMTTPIDIGATGFMAGVTAIKAGQKIKFEGASGPLVFTTEGDRPSQGARTFVPNAAVDAFEINQCYDVELNKSTCLN